MTFTRSHLYGGIHTVASTQWHTYEKSGVEQPEAVPHRLSFTTCHLLQWGAVVLRTTMPITAAYNRGVVSGLHLHGL
ncbi:hypothetical protein BPY_06570 [Bifidobacterium psychraerophilum]